MSSRLDPHIHLIFDLLNNQGRSFRAVCDILQRLEVEITPQSLCAWYHRRKKKIVVRTSPIGKVDFTDIDNLQRASQPTKSIPRPTTPPLASKPGASSRLKVHIKEQEDFLKITPFSSMHSQLMIKPKNHISSKSSK